MLVECGMISETGVDTAELESDGDLEAFIESRERAGEEDQVQDNQLSNLEEQKIMPKIQTHKQSTFFFINPDYGWDTISITSSSMQKLLCHCDVFTHFFKYLRAFGTKTFALDEGFGGFDFSIKEESELGRLEEIETCYLLKYVDKKDSPGKFSNPWSIRQALIYQKSNLLTNQDTYIFTRLSELLGEKFRDLLSKTKVKARGPRMLHWSEIHTMAFKSVVANWREYINWLDGDVSQLFDNLILAAVEPTKLGTLDSVSSSLNLMKRLQYMLDQALRTAHMLDINIEVMTKIQSAALRLKDSDGEEGRRYEELHEGLESAMSEHIFLRKNVSSLIERAKILSNQLRDTILFRNSELNKDISNLTFRGTAAIVDLSHKSSHEARVVKVLTVVALIFVPISFVADFLNMGYLKTVEGGGFSVTATNGLLLFAVLALPLVLLTFVVYGVSELYNRREAAKEKGWSAGVGGDEEAARVFSRGTLVGKDVRKAI